MTTRTPARSIRPGPFPPAGAAAAVRVGDAERIRTGDHLTRALALGYLTLAEYEQRLDQALHAHVTDDLRDLLADLPAQALHLRRQRPERAAAAPRGVRLHLALYLVGAVAALMVWLVIAESTGDWYFWPAWPILGGAVGVLSHAIPVRRCRAHHGRPSGGQPFPRSEQGSADTGLRPGGRRRSLWSRPPRC